MSQISLSAGVSNTFMTGNECDNGGSGWLGDVGQVCSIRENYIVDAFFIGMNVKGEKSSLTFDILFNTDKLSVSSMKTIYGGYQSGTKTWKDYASYSVNYGYLGIRASQNYRLVSKPRFDFALGPMAQYQVKLFENESDHYDSTYHSNSFYYSESNNGFYEEWSTNSEEFDGMSLSNMEARFGLAISSSYYFEKFQLNLFVNGGVGIRSRADFSKGTKLSSGLLHGFLEVGTKFGYQLTKKSPL